MFLIGSAVYSWAAFIRTCSFSSTCSAYLWAALHRAKTAYGHLLYKERRFSLITELSALLFSKILNILTKVVMRADKKNELMV